MIQKNTSISTFFSTGNPTIALVGSANSGKTTLFNLLTRSHYATVNYPGATVEYAKGKIPDSRFAGFTLMDTPGITSLIPSSLDEEVTVRALFEGEQRPDFLFAVVDATQLSRHLYMVHQLKTAGFKFGLFVTMVDLLEKQKKQILVDRLQNLLGVPIFLINGRLPKSRDKALDFVSSAYQSAPLQLEDYHSFKNQVDENYIANAYKSLDEIEASCITSTEKREQSLKNPAGDQSVLQINAYDKVLLHPVYGLSIFFASMFLIFTSIFWFAQPLMDGIDGGFAWMVDFTKTILPSSWITDLLADGLIAGVGAVMVFLPQIVILFLALSYLEDLGYLARGAALMDKPLSKIGLNGRSFLPLLSGYACAIPAMMAARTIPNRLERITTILVIPLMSCSARLPVYALLLAFITPKDKPWIGGLSLTLLYVMGIVMGAVVSTILSKFVTKKSKQASSFILEIPALRKPILSVVFKNTSLRAMQYLRKAGPTIIVISLGLWILTHTPSVSSELPDADEYVTVSQSYASQIGKWIEPAMRPLGLDWRAGVAMISGFAAREVFVGALALMYRIEGGDEDGLADRLLSTMQTATFTDSTERVFTVSSCIGILVFFMIALQCFPTVVVAQKEMGKWKLAITQLLVYTGGAYVLSVIVVQGLRAIGVS